MSFVNSNKDLFSQHSDKYAAFRPTYPVDLYRFIYSHCKSFEVAWDCATGNGQAAQDLALKFNKVFATDFSEKQIQNSVVQENIIYSVCLAEKTPFADNTFDVILSQFCIHNIDDKKEQEKACFEIARVLKPGGRSLIGDYIPTHSYAKYFKKAGLKVLNSKNYISAAGSLTWIVEATKP